MATPEHIGGNVHVLPKRPRSPKRKEKRPAAGRLLQFVPRHRGPLVDFDSIRCLELLLRHARLGHLTGLAFAASLPNSYKGGGYIADSAGLASRDRAYAMRMALGLVNTIAAGTESAQGISSTT